MSCRVDVAPLLPGACVVSLYAGHGVTGDQVPSTGTHGASPIYNDLVLPADAAKEYRWAIQTPPLVGALQAFEDGSYAYAPPGGTVDLTVSFIYRLWEDGIDRGTTTQIIVIGAGSSGSYTAAMASLAAGAVYAGGAAAYAAPGGAPTYLATMAAHLAGNVYAGSAAIYVAPLSSSWRPDSDVSAAGWVAVPPGSLYSTLDETIADDGDYITSIISGSSPAVLGIGPLAAGTYTLRVRAGTDIGSGVLRVRLLAADGAVLATTPDQPINTTPATYTLSMSISGTATRVALEVA